MHEHLIINVLCVLLLSNRKTVQPFSFKKKKNVSSFLTVDSSQHFNLIYLKDGHYCNDISVWIFSDKRPLFS